jgi:anthranilate synthase component 2
MFLLVDNYDSFTYNLYALFVLNGAEVELIKNNELVDADKYEGIIISPGPSHPANSGTSLEYLKEYTGKKPIFGVCLGMQAIGYHLGHEVGKAKSVMHGKIDKVKPEKSVLFDGIDEFEAVRYHSLAVKCGDDIVTARAESDGEVMALEDKEKMLFGVQFHPESVRSEHGNRIVTNFINFARGVK